MRRFRDPETRRRLDEGAQSPDAGIIGALARWRNLTFFECHTPETSGVRGYASCATSPGRAGKEPFDALLDIVVADELRTGLSPTMPRGDRRGMAGPCRRVARSDRTVVGGSDAGAHLDMMCGATYSSVLVGEAVRDRRLAHDGGSRAQLTDVPAASYGVRDRGRLAEGGTRPTSSCSIPTPSDRTPSAPTTTCPAGRAADGRRRRDCPRLRERSSDRRRRHRSPAQRPADSEERTAHSHGRFRDPTEDEAAHVLRHRQHREPRRRERVSRARPMAFSPQVAADPHPFYAALRDQCPVAGLPFPFGDEGNATSSAGTRT